MEFNNELLNQICTALDGVTTPDNDSQMKIFRQFQDLHSNLPTFCFYLLFILSSDQFPLNRRFCALLVLNRNFQRIQKELITQFIMTAKPLLEGIIKLPFSPFTSIAASMLCSMVKQYGMNYFPDFFEQISVLFTNQNTIQIGLECLKDLVQNDQQIPDSLLQILPQIINSPFYKTALEISYSLCSSNHNFVLTSILPAIFTFFKNFDEDSLSQAASIVTCSYYYSPNEIIANFLIECLKIRSRKITENILYELNRTSAFNPYPPLIFALLQLLEVPDPDLTEFGPCTMAQEVLSNEASCYGKETIQIVKTFISGQFTFINQLFQSITKGIPFDSTQNVGFFLRCLYTILPVLRDSSDGSEIEGEFQFFFTIIVAALKSTFRGDAAQCLASFCFSNTDRVTESFALISPLLIDANSGVRFQSFLALEQLVGFEELASTVPQFAFLVETMRATNDPRMASLALRYAEHFPVLNGSDKYILDFFHELVGFFVATTERAAAIIQSKGATFDMKNFYFESFSGPTYQLLVDMLSLFVKIVVEPFELIDKRIFAAALFAITNDSFDASTYTTYFELILSLLSTYLVRLVSEISSGSSDGLNFLNMLKMILNRVMTVMIGEDDKNMILINSGYKIIAAVISIVQPILQQLLGDQSEATNAFIARFIEFSADHFTISNRIDEFEEDMDGEEETAALNVELCCTIAKVMTYFICRMNFQTVQLFLKRNFTIMNSFTASDEVKCDMKLFGLKLIEIYHATNTPVDENIYKYFLS